MKSLRDRTGAGMMDCKAALQEAGGDVDKAIEILRVKGQATAAKRGERDATEGVVASYIHAGGKIGALVEVNCETDFVARTEEFQEFAREVALHVAASNAAVRLARTTCPRRPRRPSCACCASRRPPRASPRTCRRRSSRAGCDKWLEDVVLLDQKHVNEDKHEAKTIERAAHRAGRRRPARTS